MLLRRITQHVKAQNWFAVGIDFVIVVVGVFIGIQVANWNDTRHERAQESIYLQRIATELEASIEAQKEEIAFAESVFDGCNLLLEVIDQGSLDGVDPDAFETAIRRFGIVRATQLNITTFDELQSSGRINFIRNAEARSALSRLNFAFDRREKNTPELRARFIRALDTFDQFVLVTHEPSGPGWIYEYDLETLSNSEPFQIAVRRGQRLAWHTLINHRNLLTEMEASLATIKAST